jgi:CRISP-associated protein Cas1
MNRGILRQSGVSAYPNRGYWATFVRLVTNRINKYTRRSHGISRVQPTQDPPQCAEDKKGVNTDPQPLTARMLNEFVYCPRLFYYEHVEGVFVHNPDTLRGTAAHQRVDSGSGSLPPSTEEAAKQASEEAIHSRSVMLGSAKYSVICKMDLVETASDPDDLFNRLKACPVEYKVGAPQVGENGIRIWDTDKLQLGLQCLILRENGYRCDAGLIYYRQTKQRIQLDYSPELEDWIVQQIQAAMTCAGGPIPPPLRDSPKCPRCSLVSICLPDETHVLEQPEPGSGTPRRLIAPNSDRRSLYLNMPGVSVGKSSESLQVRDKKELLQEVRIADIDHVGLFGNVQITTQAVQHLCERDIPITYFSMGGWFYGIARGHSLTNVYARIQQFAVAADAKKVLPFARAFVSGKIRNQRTLLLRNHINPPTAILLRLKQAAKDANAATDIEQLLGIEGAAAATYFKHFQGMLKVDDEMTEAPKQLAFSFDFTNRNRRPPRDPVNALLSLGYSLLTKDCTIAGYAVGLDPYVGFYHQPRFGRPALALDVMEEFRPLIVDSTVLTLLNNRMLGLSDFVHAGPAVNLTTGARKAFFEAYESRMKSVVTHPVFDYKVSYRRALELQVRMIAKVITGEIAIYHPFQTR